MEWKSAIQAIEQARDIEQKKQMIDLLHQEVNQGTINDSGFSENIEDLYKNEDNPGVAALLKRLVNRVKSKQVLGKDILRQTSPLLSDQEKQELWANIEKLRSVYNEVAKEKDSGFNTRYQVIDQIGDGPMSTVHRGVRLSDKKEVALKFLKEAYFSSQSISERFNRECKLSLSFDHPLIVDVYEIDKGEKAGFMIMEYLPGGGVGSLLNHPDLDLDLSLSIIRQAAQALAYIHEQGIVHRDVKLSNLLIESWEPGRDIKIKLSDFGISKDIAKQGLTIVGTTMGTPLYWAPEQRQSPESVDQRADLYSLGVCLYRLISKGIYPEGNYPSIDEICPQASKSLNPLVMSCLETDPDKRIASAGQFLEQLNRL